MLTWIEGWSHESLDNVCLVSLEESQYIRKYGSQNMPLACIILSIPTLCIHSTQLYSILLCTLPGTLLLQQILKANNTDTGLEIKNWLRFKGIPPQNLLGKIKPCRKNLCREKKYCRENPTKTAPNKRIQAASMENAQYVVQYN